MTRHAHIIGHSIKMLGLSAIAASTTFIASSYGQRAGNQFDPAVQKRILREYAGATALCQEVRLGLECSEKFPEYAVTAYGTANTTGASLTFFNSTTGIEIMVPRLDKFAEHFGFGREETRTCMGKAVQRAQETQGNADEFLVNANYKMHCRGWQQQIDLVITLTPKSSF